MFPVEDTPERNHLKKILHTTLSTSKCLQEAEGVRLQEIGHVLRVMPQDGRTVVLVRSYLEVVVTNILARMIVKKRFAAVIGKTLANEEELTEVRKFRVLVEEIAKESFHADIGDFIPIIKWLDLRGFRRRLRNLKNRMDGFVGIIISEHREQRKSRKLMENEKDMVDVLLDQIEDKTSRFDITEEHIGGLLWVRTCEPAPSN